MKARETAWCPCWRTDYKGHGPPIMLTSHIHGTRSGAWEKVTRMLQVKPDRRKLYREGMRVVKVTITGDVP